MKGALGMNHFAGPPLLKIHRGKIKFQESQSKNILRIHDLGKSKPNSTFQAFGILECSESLGLSNLLGFLHLGDLSTSCTPLTSLLQMQAALSLCALPEPFARVFLAKLSGTTRLLNFWLFSMDQWPSFASFQCMRLEPLSISISIDGSIMHVLYIQTHLQYVYPIFIVQRATEGDVTGRRCCGLRGTACALCSCEPRAASIINHRLYAGLFWCAKHQGYSRTWGEPLWTTSKRLLLLSCSLALVVVVVVLLLPFLCLLLVLVLILCLILQSHQLPSNPPSPPLAALLESALALKI